MLSESSLHLPPGTLKSFADNIGCKSNKLLPFDLLLNRRPEVWHRKPFCVMDDARLDAVEITPASSAELPDALLSRLDNYYPAGYSPTSLRRSVQLLREHDWLARVIEPDFMYTGHDDLTSAKRAFTRQLRLLYDVGRGSQPLGRIFEGHLNALELVARFASDVQRLRWYDDVRNGHMFGVWNTEATDGIHLHSLGDGSYQLLGAKTFCSGVGDVTRPIITGQRWDNGRASGWQMLIVPMERIEASRIDDSFWTPLGMDASTSYRVDFSGLHVTADDLLGAVDDYHLQPHFSGGAVRFAAVQLGGARALYDQAVALLKTMHRQHDPYQCHRIAQMELAHETGRHWLTLTPERALPGWHADAEVVHFANMMRTAILGVCNDILMLTEEAVGARGFLEPKPIQRIYRDLKMYLRQPAPDNALAAVGRHAAEQAQLPGADDLQQAAEAALERILPSVRPAEVSSPNGHAAGSRKISVS